MHIKLSNLQPTAKSLKQAEAIFKKYNPEYPFEYHFVDEEYAKKFQDEKRTAVLAALFSGLTIFISCLGLFGLATYMAETRIKEIGVRKVLGASVTGITFLISRDFLRLVMIAFLIAAPIAWWSMYNLAEKLSLPGEYSMVGICACRRSVFPHCADHDQLPGDPRGGCKSGKQPEIGVKRSSPTPNA